MIENVNTNSQRMEYDYSEEQLQLCYQEMKTIACDLPSSAYNSQVKKEALEKLVFCSVVLLCFVVATIFVKISLGNWIAIWIGVLIILVILISGTTTDASIKVAVDACIAKIESFKID